MTPQRERRLRSQRVTDAGEDRDLNPAVELPIIRGQVWGKPNNGIELATGMMVVNVFVKQISGTDVTYRFILEGHGPDFSTPRTPLVSFELLSEMGPGHYSVPTQARGHSWPRCGRP